MRALVRGQMPLPAYCLLLRNLFAVYAALEPALLRRCGDARIAPVVLPALFRAPALEHDLDVLHGPAWRGDLPELPATRRYVAHLAALEAERPGLLVAHAYVRYLGDLSGGQMLHRIVADSLRLTAGAGTRFYDFGDARQTADLVGAFRAGLDQLGGSADDNDQVVAEARFAFTLHAELFAQLALASGLPGAAVLTDG